MILQDFPRLLGAGRAAGEGKPLRDAPPPQRPIYRLDRVNACAASMELSLQGAS